MATPVESCPFPPHPRKRQLPWRRIAARGMQMRVSLSLSLSPGRQVGVGGVGEETRGKEGKRDMATVQNAYQLRQPRLFFLLLEQHPGGQKRWKKRPSPFFYLLRLTQRCNVLIEFSLHQQKRAHTHTHTHQEFPAPFGHDYQCDISG